MNMFYTNYYIFQFQFRIVNILNSFEYLGYYDDILFLINPKLINTVMTRSSSSSSKININSVVKNDVSSVTSHQSKFDKKHRPSFYEQDSLKPKKSKVKLIKSKQKSSDDIEDAKLFVNTSDDLFTQGLLNRSSIKSLKSSSKGKKRYKLKLDPSEYDNVFQDSFQSKQDENFLQLDKSILLNKPLSINDLSSNINVPEAEIITYLFLNKGISATINDILDLSLIRSIAKNYGFNLIESSSTKNVDDLITKYTSMNTDSSITIKRAPVITLLGHVDHGKTSLLDSVLKTNLVGKESGGITQAISGYEIVWNYKFEQHKLIFLDTPGHESFKKMRLRGAKVTDIVLLVIAVDDGLKPQTIEAINYIKDMNLSCIVVITKSDKLSSNLSKIKQDLANYDMLCKEWGGNVSFIEVSAINGKNIDLLLSEICALSSAKNFLADPKKLAVGTILETYIDKKQGSIVNVIIQNGTLKLGDIIVSENLYGKVKSITDVFSSKVQSSGPSSLVQVLGFTKLPEAGSLFCVLNDEKSAKEYCLKHSNVKEIDVALKFLNTRIAFDVSLDTKQLKLILKADTQGTLEAILDLLSNISQSKVQINIISASFGNISNTDVELAVATNSYILAFNVNISSDIRSLLKKYKINFKVFNVIYDLLQYVQAIMLSLIEPSYEKVLRGKAIVQTVFSMNKGYVAGCLVNEGKITIKSYIYVYRNNLLVYDGFISSLKRIKSDVEEVVAINECGLMSNFESWKDLDIIEAYDLVPKEKTL
uniref:Translation initiation factor 2 n=1 Tax=Lophurella stichidiosa TaxID=2008659 RepID=UPI002552054D|nr:Translation initiation factor 2 [Aphanocladia stichidiosa]WGH13894.1 Translation initiation factor 2 [Aphanocladia stichidiosa]